MADTAPVGAEQKKSLTLFHISDLHFGQARCDGHIHFDQEKVVSELVKDAEKMAATLGPPDLILVTGDIAFSAKSNEYTRAKAWLEELAGAVGVGKDRILLVPGNHDVDRDLAKRPRGRLSVHSQTRANPGELDDFLLHENLGDFQENFWPKFQSFAAFAQGYGSPVLSTAEPFWKQKVSSNLGNILVLGLNTCLLSLDHTDGKVNLALSKAQLSALLSNVPAKTLVLALAHHPPECLVDGKELTKELVKHPHLLFSGHVHEMGGGTAHALGARALARVNAGAGHGSQGDGRHAYSWIQLSEAGLVWHPRAYNEGWSEFLADTDRLEEKQTSQTLPAEKLPDPLAHWLGGKVLPPQPPITPPPPAFDGLEDYLNAVCAQHRQLPLIGVNPELKLNLDIDEVYVPLRAAVSGGIYHERRWQAGMSADSGESRDVELSQAFTCAGTKRGLIILGDPGSGKTTLLKLLLVHCIHKGPETLGLPPGTVPVMLPLRELKNEKNIDAFMTRLLEQDTQLSLPPDFPRTLRQSRPLVYLLDGLDEVPDETERARVSRWIRKALDTHTTAYFAVTSRYAGYQGEARLDDHFLELNVRALREAEAQRLVGNFYRIVELHLAQEGKAELDKARLHAVEMNAKEKAEHLWSLLESDTYRTRRMRELQTNPLLLTIVCLVHQRYNSLPAERWRLYEQCVDTLLWHWQKAKNLTLPFEKLDEALRLLRPLAWWLHQQEQRRHASSKEVVRALKPTLAGQGTSDEKMGQFLKDVRDRSGLLVGWGADSYGFIHLAFQEYLSAVHLKIASYRSPALLKELARRFGESWWTEAILLLVSLPDPCLFEPFMKQLLALDKFAAIENRLPSASVFGL